MWSISYKGFKGKIIGEAWLTIESQKDPYEQNLEIK